MEFPSKTNFLIGTVTHCYSLLNRLRRCEELLRIVLVAWRHLWTIPEAICSELILNRILHFASWKSLIKSRELIPFQDLHISSFSLSLIIFYIRNERRGANSYSFWFEFVRFWRCREKLFWRFADLCVAITSSFCSLTLSFSIWKTVKWNEPFFPDQTHFEIECHPSWKHNCFFLWFKVGFVG